MKVKNDHRSKLEGRSLKNIGASTGLEPVTSAMNSLVETFEVVRCSTN